jgi:hypothetical protein
MMMVMMTMMTMMVGRGAGGGWGGLGWSAPGRPAAEARRMRRRRARRAARGGAHTSRGVGRVMRRVVNDGDEMLQAEGSLRLSAVLSILFRGVGICAQAWTPNHGYRWPRHQHSIHHVKHHRLPSPASAAWSLGGLSPLTGPPRVAVSAPTRRGAHAGGGSTGHAPGRRLWGPKEGEIY